MNANVNCGLGVLIMCQYRFIHCDKCATVVGLIDNGGGCLGVGNILEISVPSFQFYSETKTALNKVLKKTRGWGHSGKGAPHFHFPFDHPSQNTAHFPISSSLMTSFVASLN